MDRTENRVAEFLAHQGYRDVVFEPDGNIPPDFLVNGRVAVEARRLNKNFARDGIRGLETDRISLLGRMRKLAESLGPPTDGVTWFLNVWFRRPVEPWKVLQPRIRDALLRFKEREPEHPISLPVGARFRLDICRARIPHQTLYVMGSLTDRDATAWLIPEVVKNLRICIEEKTRKTVLRKTLHQKWWLILVDYIAYGLLNDFDWNQVASYLDVENHHWEMIAVLAPQGQPPACALLRGQL